MWKFCWFTSCSFSYIVHTGSDCHSFSLPLGRRLCRTRSPSVNYNNMADRPEIIVTPDDHQAATSSSPQPQQHDATTTQHRRTPSNPTLLSPVPARLDVPNSPAPSDDGTVVPPSPTLSNHSSVHWHPATTTDLRSNNPDANSGAATLGLLTPNKHRRKTSDASTAHTVADNGGPVGLESPKSHTSDVQTLRNPCATQILSTSLMQS